MLRTALRSSKRAIQVGRAASFPSLSPLSPLASSLSSSSSSSFSSSSPSYSSFSSISRRSYHTYPEPGELPEESSYVSTAKKTIIKTDKFENNNSNVNFNSSSGPRINVGVTPALRLDQPFPASEISNIIGTADFNALKVSDLSSGLKVATCNLPSFMSSFAIVVKTGR